MTDPIYLSSNTCVYFPAWCEKARKHMCVIDRNDMTLAVKVTLNPNTTNHYLNLRYLFQVFKFRVEIFHYLS